MTAGSAGSQLAEVAENHAPPEIAAVYQDMRQTMGLPLVNLVYRHFATMPGMLPWVWSALRPAMASGVVDAALARIVVEIPLPTVEAMAQAPFAASDREDVKRVLDVFNRGNGLNLVALTALRLTLDGPPQAPGPTSGASRAEPPRSVASLPPILNLAGLDAGLAASVKAVASLHAGGAGVVPSLYRHLAHWPEILALIIERVRPALADGGVIRSRNATIALARREAAAVLPALDRRNPPPAEHVPALRRTLDTFPAGVIPEMLCLGLALTKAMR